MTSAAGGAIVARGGGQEGKGWRRRKRVSSPSPPLRAATHSIVAYTDDDATPDPNWLRALLRNFGGARTPCVTGLTLPAELESEAQEVLERTNGVARGYARIIHDGTKVDPFLASRVGAGVNMAKEVLLSLALSPLPE